MKERKSVPVPVFIPKGCILLDEYLTDAKRSIAIGDTVKVQFRKGEQIYEAKVHKIIALESTGEVREVGLILLGDHKQFRTVTPDKLRRIPRNRQEEVEDMKVESFKGEIPKRTSGGRTRKPNPFDEQVAAGGTHKVTLEKDDDVKDVVRSLRSAATFGKVSVDIFHDEEGKVLLFKVVPRRTRNTKPAAPETEAAE